MLYEKFIMLTQKQDNRNKFGQLGQGDGENIPESLREFYKYANPIDVEVELDDLISIKFFPADYLENLQQEYNIDGGAFVFASKEGDPILLNDGKVYTAVHGTGQWELKYLYDSFERFLSNIVDNLSTK
jgi:hypothetical protein